MSTTLTEALQLEIAARVDQRLAELGIVGPLDTDAHYQSDGPLPPRTSRKVFNAKAPSVPGAVKLNGKGKGYWKVSRDAWHRSQLRAVPEPAKAKETDEQRADAMIAAAGCRPTRRASR